MSQIDALPPLREVVERHALMAQKSLGQNFLFDLNLTGRIARAAGEKPELASLLDGFEFPLPVISISGYGFELAKSPVMKPVDDKSVWSVVCFYTALDARNTGVSAAMLRHAARFAQENGATLLEAYPVDGSDRARDDAMWFGAKRMYDAAGFHEVARRKARRPIVRKALRSR